MMELKSPLLRQSNDPYKEDNPWDYPIEVDMDLIDILVNAISSLEKKRIEAIDVTKRSKR
jgi:hypothetical protein